jgi:hypothetical protein
MDAALQKVFAAAPLDPEQPPPAGLVTATGGDPGRRFAICRNNVVVSLTEALEARFPVTRALVGADFFRQTARAFVHARPPRSPVLLGFGDELPAFLESYAPVRELPYPPDPAALEAARGRAFHAADAAPIGPGDLAGLDPEALAELRLRLHPSVELLASPFPVVTLWATPQHPDPAAIEVALAALDTTRGEEALVWRLGEEVGVRALAPGELPLFAALSEGEPLAAAAGLALEAEPPFDLPSGLALLLGAGLAVHPEARGGPR